MGGREREREEGGVERKLKREKEAEPDSARENDTSLEVYLRLVPAVYFSTVREGRQPVIPMYS